MARKGREVALVEIDWPALVRKGDLVVWGQASGEPTDLVKAVLAARAAIGRLRAFSGISFTDVVSPAYGDSVAYASYCGTGPNARLGDALDIWPLPYGQLAEALDRHDPILLLSLAPGVDEDHFCWGAAGDYCGDLIDRARLVIAEVRSGLPMTGAGREVCRGQIDLIVRGNAAPPAPSSRTVSEIDRMIGNHVAGLIDDGATLQIGLGSIPAAVLHALAGHRNLGIHSGMIGDDVALLAEQGVITNARKPIDRGVAVTGLLGGGTRLMAWADGNQALSVRTTRYTHSAAVLRAIDHFVAINSAIEVDLTGQVNAEVADGRYVGAIGGAGAFLRGALESRGGLPIIALPSTSKGRSRIVARLSGPVSTARCDVGIVVTEHGVADLRGLGLRDRHQRMLAIADPAHVHDIETDLAEPARK